MAKASLHDATTAQIAAKDAQIAAKDARIMQLKKAMLSNVLLARKFEMTFNQ